MSAGFEMSGNRAAWPESMPSFARRRGGGTRATQVILVCSARARVGKTLTARMIVEYCRLDARPVAGFSIAPIDVALGDFLTDGVSAMSLTETRGQMALFDRLILDDATTKVVDIGHQALDRFFTLAYDIEYTAEARNNGLDVIVAYVADTSDLSARTYDALIARFPEVVFVPVFNEAVVKGDAVRNRFAARPSGAQPLQIPRLSPQAQAIADHPPFSFNTFLRQPPSNLPRALHEEIGAFRKHVNRHWRETELSLLLNRLRTSLSDNPQRSGEI